MNNAAAHRLQLAKWCKLYHFPAPSGPVVDAFVAAMGDNQYGVEETWDAFVWFRLGFEATIATRDYCMVRVSDVAALMGLLPPPPVEKDGKQFEFVDPDPRRTLQAAGNTVKEMMKHVRPVVKTNPA